MISANELTCWQRCPQEHHYRYHLGRDENETVPAIALGKSVHEFLASHWAGIAIDCPTIGLLEPFEAARCDGILRRYRQHYADDRERFAVVGVDMRLEKGPLYGYLDALASDGDGPLVIEHKTTSVLREEYWLQREFDVQISTYCVIADANRVLYDVIETPRVRPKQGESKDGFEERCYAATGLERRQITRSAEQLEAFVAGVKRVLPMISDEPTHRNTSACSRYGRPCQYLAVCAGTRAIGDLPCRQKR